MYIKISNNHIKHLIDFVKNCNDIKSIHQHINGVLVLSKQCNIKQILIDYQTIGVYDYSKVFKKDKRIELLKLISNKDPHHNFVLTFDIELSYNNKSFICNNIPNIYQFVKVVIYSIIRQVHNHLYITALDERFIISMKKPFYFKFYNIYIKQKNKNKNITEFMSYIFKEINLLYSEHNITNNYCIPELIKANFNIYNIKNKDINTPYTYYKTIL